MMERTNKEALHIYSIPALSGPGQHSAFHPFTHLDADDGEVYLSSPTEARLAYRVTTGPSDHNQYVKQEKSLAQGLTEMTGSRLCTGDSPTA